MRNGGVPSVAFVEDSKHITRDYATQLRQEWQIPVCALTLTDLRATEGPLSATDFHSSRKESPAAVYNGASFAAEIRRDDADGLQSS